MMAKMQPNPQFQADFGEGASKKAHNGITKHTWSRLLVVTAISVILGMLLFLPVLRVSSAHAQPGDLEAKLNADASPYWVPVPDAPQTHSQLPPSAPLQQAGAPTLAVAILSSPYAVYDHNNPVAGPNVFALEAVITNTSSITPAQGVEVEIDFGTSQNWRLLPLNGTQTRIYRIGTLAPDEARHVYWLASYPKAEASHLYTVTVSDIDNNTVFTTYNYYIPDPNRTVQTQRALEGGTSRLLESTTDIVVGVAFTNTVEWSIKNVRQLALSPVGNDDFDVSSYRLVGARVSFVEKKTGQQPITITVVNDRLYFPTLPATATHAVGEFVFLALKPSATGICPYAAPGYVNDFKYDNAYCSPALAISGTVALSLTKQASTFIQQGQYLTYTINYTNTSDLDMGNAWIWDEVDTAKGSIVTQTIDPPDYHPDEISNGRVAWYIGNIPGQGQLGSTGTLTFAIWVDGQNQDLLDGTPLVNNLLLGINPDGGSELPVDNAAFTHTITTTIQAPIIEVAKTDGLTSAEPGDALTYTLRITNSGSVAATNLVITDVLPAYVALAGPTTPATATQTDHTLVWTTTELASGGGTFSITIPVSVDIKTPYDTSLVNSMATKYENPAGWIFDTKTATDTTAVNAPLLTISKSDDPDPVLTGKLITYTLHYTNSGLATASNVVITDRVPTNTTYQAGSCTGTCALISDPGGDVVSWTIGTVFSGTNDTVSFSVLVTDAETLQTGDFIYNDDYGISAGQTDFVSGTPEATEVSREAAFFEGYAFEDENCNGVYDISEEGFLSGITITLPSAVQPVTYTNEISGYYHFRVETEGPITMTAALPTGPITYFRTTPGSVVFADSVLGETRQVNFGYAPYTATCGVIYGTVFEDLNHNGQQDLGEDGLLGVSVASTEAVTSPVTTNDLGWYTLRFDIIDTATVTVTEVANPAGYVSTTPDVVQVTARRGDSGDSPVDFGDFPGIKITGTVFYDADVDGIKDGSEGGVPGATVKAGSDSSLTLDSGVYTLYVTLSDSNPVTITETDPGGYVSTDAVPGAGMSRVDANRLRIDSPISGNIYTGDFGDVLASDVVTISGQVWNDNGAGIFLANGQLDTGEDGLAGAVVSLTSGLSQTTGSNGLFVLYAPPNKVITVTETNPDGYVSTNAIPGDNAGKYDNDTLVISPLVSGTTSADNLFGDVSSSSVALIAGTVFDDSDANGVFSPTIDSGLSGVTVTLEISGVNTIVVRTDSNGHYQMAMPPGRFAWLSSAGPEDASYYPTTLERVPVQPSAAGVYPDHDFGYSTNANRNMIFGLVFDDFNSNGQLDEGELGLAGAVITLTDSSGIPISVITTTGNGAITGTFIFPITRPEESETIIYSLHEQNPPGYRSTTADTLNIPVIRATRVYSAEFGDTNNPNSAAIYGIVFEDLNCNGVQDGDETGLPGVVISVTTGVYPYVQTTTTKAYGQFTYGFLVLEEIIHTVTEQDPARDGYHSTTPDAVTLFTELGESYEVNFGDKPTDLFPCVVIWGTVYNDQANYGIKDPLEPGIENVLVSLSNEMTDTTDLNGLYRFSLSTSANITVTERDPVGFHSTTPNTVPLTVNLGETHRVDFGDSDEADASHIFGTVFEDTNVNGGRDPGEPPLSGASVAITGTFDVPPSPYTTNDTGQYSFRVDYTGIYTLTEADPQGYFSTNAIPGDPAAVAKIDNNTLRASVSTLGTDLGDNLFGDVQASQVITISGYVWDDNGAGTGGVGGDGQRNGSEPGLAGADILLSSGLSDTTGSDGFFSVLAPPETVITVSETNPAGYFSINAIPGENASKVDNDTLVVSAVSGGLVLTNNLFGDVLTTTLGIDKSFVDVDGPPIDTDDVIRYTLRVTNSNTYTAFKVVVVDTWPVSVTLVTSSTTKGSVISNTGLITWTVGDVAPSVAETLYLTGTLNNDTAAQFVFNTGTVTGSNIIGAPPTDDVLFFVGQCTPDDYEADNNVDQAKSPALDPSNPVIQGRTFHVPGDQDWLKLMPQPGASYMFATSDLALMADTELTLYAADAATVLARNDDADPNVQYSRIEWTAELTPPIQTVYLVISQEPGSGYSCNTGYTMSLTQTVGGVLTGSTKTVDPTSANLAFGAPVTYTITLSNSDPDNAAAPVTVTDTLPATLTLQSVQVCGSSGEIEQYQAPTLDSNSFTWQGALGKGAQMQLCVQATVELTPWASTNTAWITWNDTTISVSATGVAGPGGIYLPIILKNQ